MKEQEKFPEELKEIEASNLSGRDFRVMILRLFDSMQKDIKTIKEDQSELKNVISEINNTLGRINSRIDEAEDRISVLEDKVEKISQPDQQKEKRILKNEESLRNILDNMKHKHSQRGRTRRRR